ncbi:hypothetical protein SUGI_0659170 [Cryptomeria japonica]|nr:hypothetical protein SUGI_0659170 [Cryptomeria japonica]
MKHTGQDSQPHFTSSMEYYARTERKTLQFSFNGAYSYNERRNFMFIQRSAITKHGHFSHKHYTLIQQKAITKHKHFTLVQQSVITKHGQFHLSSGECNYNKMQS